MMKQVTGCFGVLRQTGDMLVVWDCYISWLMWLVPPASVVMGAWTSVVVEVNCWLGAGPKLQVVTKGPLDACHFVWTDFFW